MVEIGSLDKVLPQQNIGFLIRHVARPHKAGYPGGRRAAALLGDPRNDAQPRLMVLMFCWLGILATFAVQDVRGQNFSLVPGEVIDYVEAPDFLDVLFGSEVYISSPSITIMPNGDYIASHDLFDNGTNENQTRVFRSTNKGQSWTLQSTVTGAFQSTVFQHNGALYLFGPREGAGSNGDILIRKSTNNGVSWTNPTDATNGLLVDGDFGGTPNSPVIYNGRIWIAQSGRRHVRTRRRGPVVGRLLDPFERRQHDEHALGQWPDNHRGPGRRFTPERRGYHAQGG